MFFYPRGLPIVAVAWSLFSHVMSVRTFKILVKLDNVQVKIVIATGWTIGLAEWIIDVLYALTFVIGGGGLAMLSFSLDFLSPLFLSSIFFFGLLGRTLGFSGAEVTGEMSPIFSVTSISGSSSTWRNEKDNKSCEFYDPPGQSLICVDILYSRTDSVFKTNDHI